MDNRKITLPAAGQTQVRGNIKRVVIRRASGPVFIETDMAEAVEAIQGDNILFEKACGVMTVTDTSGFQNELTLLLVGSSEGDVSNAAGTVDVANATELGRAMNAGADSVQIRRYDLASGDVQILGDNARRVAVISTNSDVKVSLSQGDAVNYFVVNGVLEHAANGALWASGVGVVEVLEYLS